MSVTVYADVACPLSYVAMQRVDRLIGRGLEVDWRLVERERAVPAAGVAPAIDERALLQARVDRLHEVLHPGEYFPMTAPSVVPDTRATVVAYAQAYQLGVAAQARRVLFHAYWIQGLDVGDADVLRMLLADLVPAPSGPVSLGLHRRVRDWRYDWTQRGGRLPTVVTRERVAYGHDALAVLDDLAQRPVPRARRHLVAAGQ